MISLIAMVDMGDGIGDDKGNLLFNIPKDMAHFKKVTKGKKVVMGRKTWDSLPKKPLKNRENYVLTNQKDFKDNGAKVIHSIDDVLELSKDEDLFVIGGGEIYKSLMPYADRLIITHVHSVNINARTFFPSISPRDWKIDSENMVRHEEDDNRPSFTIATYNRAE